MELNFNEKYNIYKENFEWELYSFFDNLHGQDSKIIEAMSYSIKAGGKRLRPVIMTAAADMLGVKHEKVIPFAVSIECIHTYSLIHDDLPCMDNDDYRRGKLTNHKVFGAGMATLAGDALLNLAYENVFRHTNDIYSVNAAKVLSSYSGFDGMIAGQSMDISNLPFSEETLLKIHRNKTSKLIEASLLIPSCLAGDRYISELKDFGTDLGVLFQLTDDILDVTSTREVLGKSVAKDSDENKLTFVTFYGLDKAMKLKDNYLLKIKEDLSKIPGSDFFTGLSDQIYSRNK